MRELHELPETFEEVRQVAQDIDFSERVIDPLVLVDKVGGKIVACLAGTRVLRGARKIYKAPSNRHSWVMDESTLRPLPRDAAYQFGQMLCGADAGHLTYSQAIGLIREPGEVMAVTATESFLNTGQTAAADLPGDIAVPGLTASLYPYQARGVRWMAETIRNTNGLILADEMGLGKTIQIIALLLLEKPEDRSPALIVCPTTLIANWVREFGRFAPGLTVAVHRGPDRAGVYRELQKSAVVITTYDTLVNDVSIFSSFEWSWVICDEAQAIKNPDSARRQAMATIPRRRTIPMTGTPVENGLLDLWSLMDFAIPGLLGTRSAFENAFPDSVDSARAVADITDPLILKRLVADVASDLPERIDIDEPLELDDVLADHYMQVRKDTLAKYPVAGALVATLQLQLVCAHPWLRRTDESDPESDEASIVRTGAFPLMTPKLERAVSLVREAFFNGHKVLVFALFNRIGSLLKEGFTGFPGAHWNAINGSTPQKERQQIVDVFSAHKGPGCLVLNPKAAGTGLNITCATVVIHFTPVWNPALEAQASARAHRLGQTRPVTIYRLFYKGTVEEVMIDRARWKRELANESVPVSTRDAGDLARALSITPEKS